MRQKPKMQEADQFMARLPGGLRDALKREAEINRRSMNSELVIALKSYLSQRQANVEARGS